MSPDILLKVESLLTEKGLFDEATLKKFISKMKPYTNGKWVYPGTFKRHLGVGSQLIYNAFNLLKNEGVLEAYYEVYCPKCSKTSGEVYRTFTEIPEEYECEQCCERIGTLENTLMIYKVIKDGNKE